METKTKKKKKGAWHIHPTSYYLQKQLRDDENLVDYPTVYDTALSDPRYEIVVYFHGNALNRVAPWRTDLYKVV